jgi:hypothetical protein
MEIKLTGPKTLNLPSQAVAYILDSLAKRPYNEVNELMAEIFSQLKAQEEVSAPVAEG